MKRFVIGFMVLVALSFAGRAEARGDLVSLDISYTGLNLGVSGSGVVQGISAGNGEYDLVGGYINAVLPYLSQEAM